MSARHACRVLPLTDSGIREASVATRRRQAATAACAAAIVALGIFATPALASDGTSTPTAADATEVPSPSAEAPSATSGNGDSTTTTTTATVPSPADGNGDGVSTDVALTTDSQPTPSTPPEQPPPTPPPSTQPPETSTPPATPPPTAYLTQDVGATAEAHQDGATNTSVVVRNDAPGDSGPVSQANTASATASGAAIGTTAGNAGLLDAPSTSLQVLQDVQAGAIATQSGVANTNVSVRIGSAGDSGPVSQANTATATAAAEASDPTAATQALSSALQDGAANTNVSVRVFSPGDDGTVSQANAASASASAADATAQAEQTDLRNTNVSIRIASPGSEGGATQGSSSATGTGDVENHDGSTDIRIRVDGPDLADPTYNSTGPVSVWRWTWQWEYDDTLGLPFDFEQAGSDWNWDWTGGGAPDAGTPLTSDLAPGSFVWSWNWERDGDSTLTWDLNAPLSCNCVIIWDWAWTWKGSGVDADGSAPAEAGAISTATEQQNSATAVAEASVLADVSQTSIRDDDPGTSFAGQRADLTQLAGADASAVQSGALNELGAPGSQANLAHTDALASADAFVTQELVQARSGPEETSQWAGQQVGLGQLLVAQAAATQSDAQNLGSSQTTLAAADAEALGLAKTSQQLDQLGLSLGGTQAQWAGQQTSLAQTAAGVALVDQSGARDGASALASSSAAAKAITSQSAEQKAIGALGLRSQRSAQLAVVDQLGTSAATTTQSTSAHTNREASSKASTSNAGLVEQRAAQELIEGSLISIQDSTQQSLLVQVAHASSPSLGGKAGTATVSNCATVGQASGQGIGSPVVVATADHSTFCFPPELAAPAQHGDVGQTPDTALQAQTVVHGSVALTAESDVELRRAYGVYVGVHRGSWPMLSSAHGSAPGSSPTAGGAFATVARPPQTSAAIVPAPPSGHDRRAAVRDHAEQLLQWPLGLLPEVAPAGSTAPGGGGGMAAAIAPFLPAVLTGWRVVARSVVRRPTHFALIPERPG